MSHAPWEPPTVTTSSEPARRMPRVSPKDVDEIQFTSRRFRLGYDETEVDDFLDQVAETLAQDQRAADEIRTVCADVKRRSRSSLERALAATVLDILDHPERGVAK